MSADVGALRSAMNFFCCTKIGEDICRLCLRPIENNKISFEEIIIIDKPYCSESLTFLDLFDELGYQVDDELPRVICKDCANVAFNAYVFQKLCAYSAEKWNFALEKLNDCVTDTENIQRDVKTAFLSVIETKAYTSSKVIKTKAQAQIAMKNKRYYKTKKTAPIFHDEVTSDRNGSFPCRMCIKSFPTIRQVQAHMERVHSARTIKCSKCDKKFASQSLLKIHNYVHHVPITCHLCCLRFSNRYNLNKHLAKHETLTCPNCNKSYANKHYYKTHVKSCLSISERVYEMYYCDICSKGYRLKNSLRSHLKMVHNFGKLYICSWCDKKFDAISRLNSHIVKHTKEKNFSCEMCGCSFVTSAALVNHKRLHTGERPFPCDMCDEAFLSASRRMEHKHRKHFGPQKACPLCSMKFTTNCQLNKHAARHRDPASKLYARAPPRLEAA